MKLDQDLFAFTVIVVAFIALCGVLTYVKLTHDSYPESTEDCPPGHVYIDYGETPQRGCWPEGAARDMGVWPWP